ncbi:MAG: anion permease [Dehalococcoidia bacterium]
MFEVPSIAILVVTIILGLAYAYSNGLNDAANALATVVSTRVLTPLAAVVMGGVMNLAGALTGTAVAKTISKGVVKPDIVDETTALAAIGAAVIWVLLATRRGFPVSVSHALIAGLVGAGLASAGMAAIIGSGVIKVVIALAASPLVAFLGGLLIMSLLYRLGQWLTHRFTPPYINAWFGRLQILSAMWLSYAHGKNDGQNAMGIITLGLAVYYGWSAQEVFVPLWVILASALAIALGTGLGGWRVIRTLGMRVTKLQPINGFGAEATAGSVIEAASLIGLPISTTHTATSAIVGVGATRRLSAVRWGVTREIMAAWLVSYPVCFALGWALSTVLGLLIA